MYIHQKLGGNFRCPHCPDKVYKFKSGLKSHLRSHSEDDSPDYTYSCRICQYGTFFKMTYEHHFVDVHQGENPYKCVYCEATFVTEMSRQEHVQMYHPEMDSSSSVFNCTMCSRVYYSQNQYENHMRKSHKIGNFECPTCTQTFTSASGLKSHVENIHKLQPGEKSKFQCEKCSKMLSSKSALHKHMLIHSQENPFVCKEPGCTYATKTRYKLLMHDKRIHKGEVEKPFFCETCLKRFPSTQKLREHTRIHTGERPFKCHVCEYTCALRGNLKKHMKVHEK